MTYVCNDCGLESGTAAGLAHHQRAYRCGPHRMTCKHEYVNFGVLEQCKFCKANKLPDEERRQGAIL